MVLCSELSGQRIQCQAAVREFEGGVIGGRKDQPYKRLVAVSFKFLIGFYEKIFVRDPPGPLEFPLCVILRVNNAVKTVAQENAPHIVEMAFPESLR
jgi:hypothetical protein